MDLTRIAARKLIEVPTLQRSCAGACVQHLLCMMDVCVQRTVSFNLHRPSYERCVQCMRLMQGRLTKTCGWRKDSRKQQSSFTQNQDSCTPFTNIQQILTNSALQCKPHPIIYHNLSRIFSIKNSRGRAKTRLYSRWDESKWGPTVGPKWNLLSPLKAIPFFEWNLVARACTLCSSLDFS